MKTQGFVLSVVTLLSTTTLGKCLKPPVEGACLKHPLNRQRRQKPNKAPFEEAGLRLGDMPDELPILMFHPVHRAFVCEPHVICAIRNIFVEQPISRANLGLSTMPPLFSTWSEWIPAHH